MNLRSQRRIASEILKCGYHRVWVDPEFIEDVEMAISREDVRELIKEGKIKKRQEKGTSRFHAKERLDRKQRGLARGPGKRKGAKNAIVPLKRHWINTIRPLRRKLKELRNTGDISPTVYRKLYRQAKGGVFHSVSHLVRHIDENKLRS